MSSKDTKVASTKEEPHESDEEQMYLICSRPSILSLLHDLIEDGSLTFVEPETEEELFAIRNKLLNVSTGEEELIPNHFFLKSKYFTEIVLKRYCRKFTVGELLKIVKCATPPPKFDVEKKKEEYCLVSPKILFIYSLMYLRMERNYENWHKGFVHLKEDCKIKGLSINQYFLRNIKTGEVLPGGEVSTNNLTYRRLMLLFTKSYFVTIKPGAENSTFFMRADSFLSQMYARVIQEETSTMEKQSTVEFATAEINGHYFVVIERDAICQKLIFKTLTALSTTCHRIQDDYI